MDNELQKKKTEPAILGSESVIVQPAMDEVLKYGDLGQASLRKFHETELNNQNSDHLLKILEESSFDFESRLSSAEILSQRLLEDKLVDPLKAKIEKAYKWETTYDPDLIESSSPCYTAEESLTGKLAAFALQTTSLINKDLRSFAIRNLLYANSVSTSDRRELGKIMLMQSYQDRDLADFIAVRLMNIKDVEFLCSAIDTIVGLDSENAAYAFLVTGFTKIENVRDSSFRREFKKKAKYQAQDIKHIRRDLDGNIVDQEYLKFKEMENELELIENLMEMTLRIKALKWLAVYRPGFHDEIQTQGVKELNSAITEIKDKLGLNGGFLTPEILNLEQDSKDLKIPELLAIIDKPIFKKGEEKSANKLALDLLKAEFTDFYHSMITPRSEQTLIGTAGGWDLAQAAFSTSLLNRCGFLESGYPE